MVGVRPVGGQERGLVDAELAHPPMRSGSSTSGVPCSITAFMIVHQHTPSSSATLRHRAGVLTDLAARLRPGPAGQHRLGVDVLGVLRPRLRLTAARGSATAACATPAAPAARSRPDPGRRPASDPAPRPAPRSCRSPLARAPSRPGRPTLGPSVTSSTRNPASPNSASARPVPSLIIRGLPSLQPSEAATMAGPLAPVVDAPATSRSPLQREEPEMPAIHLNTAGTASW